MEEMDLDNILSVQHQIKENTEDLKKYLLGFESWEKEMKQKEEELKLIQMSPEEEIPPIRNSLYRPKRKNKHKKQKEKSTVPSKVPNPVTDYQSWEKFDVEAEIKKIDEEAKESSTSENSENEEFLIQKRQQLALVHKDKGNNFFKSGNYDSAINCYTTGLQLDPENPLLAANRAMALIKKGQFQAAENDCNLCLSIDPTYVKAYLRRGTARKNLKKFSLAKDDFMKALELEPENKQAQAELKILTEDSDVKMNISALNEENNWEKFEVEVKKKLENNINDQTIIKNNANHTEEMVESVVCKPNLPPVPVNSYQFLSDWNAIASYPDLRYQYLKQFPPEKFPVVFKHDMEPEIFSKLIETLSTSFIEHGDDVFDYMKYLTDVGRFQTMVMFLSGKEEDDLKKLFEYMKTSERPESEISLVLNKYGA